MVNSKETLGQPGQELSPNDVKIRDLEDETEVRLPSNVEGWIEKVEKASETGQKTITDDKTGQTILGPAAPTNPVLVLPVTRSVFAAGLKKTVSDAGRWLSVFVLRVIKKNKGKVKFKKNDN